MTERSVPASEMMGNDHRELDGVWERFRATPESDFVTRREVFDSFRAGLLHHIAIEEDQLFPP